MTTSPKLTLRSPLRLARGMQKPPPPGVVVEGSAGTCLPAGSDEAVASIDAILAKARPKVDRTLRRREMEIVERERALLLAEQRTETERRELKEREICLHERERECSEREMLLAIREGNVELREALLSQDADSADAGGASLSHTYKALREKLDRHEQELRKQAAKLDSRDKAIATRERTLQEASQKTLEVSADAAAIEARLKEIAERELMLNEREAFIEQSENVLFNRAQELQEFEAQLSQFADCETGEGEQGVRET